MKLGAVIFAAFAMASCASSSCPAEAVKTAQAPVVSTTRLTSADLADTEFAPLVGKSQHGMAPKTDDASSIEPKDGRRHEGSGFSGWK